VSFDRKYLVCALGYAAAGMALGIYMAASHNHGQFVTHAHILLVGFVASLIYAVIHRLWLQAPARALAMAQFVLHQAGALAMSVGLLLLYGGFVSEDRLDPVLAPSAIAVLLGVLLMLFMVLRTRSSAAKQPSLGADKPETIGIA
jgi:hypothetical protein